MPPNFVGDPFLPGMSAGALSIGAIRLDFDQTGYVAAGPHGPVMLLDPTGDVRIPAGDLHVQGDLFANTMQASVVVITSDGRLKTNVTPITRVLDKLAEVQGVTYDWNETAVVLGRATGRREIGMIAQDVEAVFPELVTTWGPEDYKAIQYDKFTAVLVEALKELRVEKDAQIAALEARLARLEQAMTTQQTTGLMTFSMRPGSGMLIGGLVLAGMIRKRQKQHWK